MDVIDDVISFVEDVYFVCIVVGDCEIFVFVNVCRVCIVGVIYGDFMIVFCWKESNGKIVVVNNCVIIDRNVIWFWFW